MWHHFLQWICLERAHPARYHTGLRWTGLRHPCQGEATAVTIAVEKDIKVPWIKSAWTVMLESSWLHSGCCRLHCISNNNRKHHFSALLSAVVLGTENFHASKCWSVDSFFRWAVVKSCWVCCCRILFVQDWWAEFCYQLPVWNGLGLRSRNLWFQRCLESLLLIFIQDSIHQG